MTAARDVYIAKYGRVKSIAGASGLQNVFGDGGSTHRRSLVTRNPRVIMTGASPDTPIFDSFDPTFLAFIRKFRDECDQHFKPELDARGFSLNGVHTGAERLGCVAGYMMNPMSYTAVDNAAYRKELGLSSGYSPRQREIAKNICRIVFSEWHATDVNIPKLSTSGTIRYTHDADWKADHLGMVLDPVEFERMLNLVAAKDSVALAGEFEMICMTYIQTRLQNEAITKRREVFDLDYALSGGRSGKKFDADKRVVLRGMEYADLSATRARVIHAGPWAVNGTLQVMFSGVMKSMFRRFPDVFHVTTPEALKALVDGHYVYCGDVKEYDRSMSQDAMDVVHEVLAEFWDPRLVALSRRLAESPYYSRPLELDGTRGVFVGDPRDWDTVFTCGNRSGHAGTSVIAKVNKVIDDALVLDHMGLDILGHELELLQGKLAIKIINNGDDCVAYTKSESLMKQFEAARANPKAGHYIVEREIGAVYSGFMLVIKDAETLTYEPQRRLYTPFEKWYVPERSAGSRHRRFAAIGFMERINSAATYNWKGSEIWELHNDLWRSMMSPTFGDFMSIIADSVEAMPLQFGSLSAIDKDVLDDPERIHYKWLPEEVDPDVLAQITAKVPYMVIKHVPQNYFNGRITE